MPSPTVVATSASLIRWKAAAGVATVLVLATTARLWGIGFGLPLVEARPDEPQLVQTALAVLHGDLNPHFFNYPSAFIYVLAALYGLLFLAGAATGLTPTLATLDAALTADPSAAYLMARLLVAACGVATVHVTWRLAREQFGRQAGVSAALLLALTYLHARDSHFGVTDIPLTLLVTASVLFILRANQHGRLGDYARAGALAGLATATKYNGLLLLAPLGLLVMFGAPVPAVHSRGRSIDGSTWTMTWRRAGVIAACAVAVAIVATPFAVLDHNTFVRDFLFEMRHLQAGHGTVDLGRGWAYHAAFTLPIGVGWPVLAAAAAGLLLAIRRRPRVAALLFAFPVCYYASAGSGRTVFVRYMVPLTPFLAVAAGVFVSTAAGHLSRFGGQFAARGGSPPACHPRRSPAGSVAVVVLSLVLAGPSAWRLWNFDSFLTRTDSRLIAAEWLGSRVPPGARVYQSGSRYGHVVLPVPYVPIVFDEAAARFRAATGRVSDALPDWIVIPRSPLTYYSQTPAPVAALIGECYALEQTIVGVGADPAARFDQQDAFYVPLAAGDAATRPGPDIAMYRRRPRACSEWPDAGGDP